MATLLSTVVLVSMAVTFVESGPAAASSWVPIEAPAPTVLPSGNPPVRIMLTSTACSASAFCVAVGSASDGASNVFPLIETYSSGSWLASVAPLPPNASENPWSGVLSSVACQADGSCVAVGNYYSYDPGSAVSSKNGLLDTLTAGHWSTLQAPLPNGPGSGSASVNSVSCPDDTTCMAVGTVTTFATRETTSGLLYTRSGGTWQVQVVPLSSPFVDSLNLSSISCPDDNDCTAVGSYVLAHRTHGLLATVSFGVWSVTEAPEPSNASSGPFSPSEPPLTSVDCPQTSFCVVGGAYPLSRASGRGNEAMLLIYQFGSWVALEAPLPSDADSATLESYVESVYCPAVNNCVAGGTYNSASVGSSEGMLLAQAASTWSAVSSPTLGDDASTSISGVTCNQTGFCVAVGDDGASGLIESDTVGAFPSVTAISPSSGTTAGGTNVTITGNDFSPGSSASFGGVPASTTYDNAGELTATSPMASHVGPVAVTVSDGGLASRGNVSFLYQPPLSATTTATVLASSNNPSSTGQSTTYTAQVSPSPDGGTIDFLDDDVAIATCQNVSLQSGQGQCTQTYDSIPGDGSGPGSLDVSAQYSGDLNYGASSASLTQAIDVSTLSITTTTLPKGHANRTYSVSLTASGGNAPYQWTVASGSQLPPGLTLSEAGGVLSGRPTKAMTYIFTVRVTDSTSPTPFTSTEMVSLRIVR